MNQKGPQNDNTRPALVGVELTPAEKASVEKIVRESVKDVISKPQQQQIIDRLVPKVQSAVVSVSKHHSGPLPAIETARGYEDILPGSFQRVLQMAEIDQDAFIESHQYQASLDSFYRICCLISGMAALLAILAVVLYLAERGHENVAMSVAGLGVVGIVGTFVNGWFKRR